MVEDGGNLLRMLPMHFLFSAEDCERLAKASTQLIAIQTKLLRHMVRTDGREHLLDLFRTPESMRRFVNWQELLEPEYLVARHDILETPGGYRFCECNVDSCVAAAEIFDFMTAYFAELGNPLAIESGLVSPLATFGEFLGGYVRGKEIARVVILDWSAGGGSAGKGYLSYERMRSYWTRALGGIPVWIADEKTYDRQWLTPQEATRTLVHRGFMMEEMDDGGAFLDQLVDSGTRVFSTYESEIRANKLWFALYRQERYKELLTDEERALIASYVPATWQIRGGNFEKYLAEKNRFVFKRNQGYSGAGVLLGEGLSASVLRRAIEESGVENWTAQELCETIPSMFPFDEKFHGERQNLVFGLYQYGSLFNGMLIRSSVSSKIVNAGSGLGKLAWGMCLDERGRERAGRSLEECFATACGAGWHPAADW